MTPSSSSSSQSDDSFRLLLDLDDELHDYLSQFLRDSDALQLLTISRRFYTIYSRRLWRSLSPNTTAPFEVDRNPIYSKYGELVQGIGFTQRLMDACNVKMWPELFPNITKLRMSVRCNQTTQQRKHLLDLIEVLQHLRVLTVNMEIDEEPFTLNELHVAIFTRSTGRFKQPIECFKLVYCDPTNPTTWDSLRKFINDMKTSTYIYKYLGLEVPIPTKQELGFKHMDSLRDHLAHLPFTPFTIYADRCNAIKNYRFFSHQTGIGTDILFPLLRKMNITVCCVDRMQYEYDDFTPEKFPVLTEMELDNHSCTNLDSKYIEQCKQQQSLEPTMQKPKYELGQRAYEVILMRKWPLLKTLRIKDIRSSLKLREILEVNSQLEQCDLTFHHRKYSDHAKIYQIKTILDCVPNITSLCLSFQHDVTLDADWIAAGFDHAQFVTKSRLTSITLYGMTLTTRMVQVLFMLPKLINLRIEKCELEDEDEVSEMLVDLINYNDTERYPCPITEFSLCSDENIYDISLDILTDAISLMTRLKVFTFIGPNVDIPQAVKDRFKYLEVFYEKTTKS
ncbi:hypothetical protein GQ42DRAFT_164116 [Ramicandelaber brevisporus]|nr:hypothetical protein GQ42DRAFT_164116 [Ramicandelaber brevisporus]